MEQTDSCLRGGRRREQWKEGEGTSQRTCMNDPWTWTMVWGLTVGTRGRLDGRGQRGGNWDNYNRITIKKNMMEPKHIYFNLKWTGITGFRFP